MAKKIKNDLLELFDNLLLNFPTIEIKYEYRTDFRCYFVSVDVSRLSEAELDAFSNEYLQEISLLQQKYGDDAPLFCMNEEWFSLSPLAVTYISCNWCDSFTVSSSIRVITPKADISYTEAERILLAA